MSNMDYPQSISLPGAPAGPEGGAPPALGATEAVAAVKQAKALVQKALLAEKDHQDVLVLEKVTTLLQGYLASNEKLVDSATGAGSGERLIRKLTG